MSYEQVKIKYKRFINHIFLKRRTELKITHENDKKKYFKKRNVGETESIYSIKKCVSIIIFTLAIM